MESSTYVQEVSNLCVYAMGKAVGEAIAAWDSSKTVAVIGFGGLSHPLDGERAGHINKAFDLQFMESLVSNPNGPPSSAFMSW